MNDFIIKSGMDWTYDDLYRVNDEIEKIGAEMGYSWYPNQVEIISSEQMLDAYSTVGLPLMYNHWSFGKSFLKNQDSYIKGKQGLAYEIVINSDPCIVYIMEGNDLLMQTLVLAHAGIGHNHFFKNNQLFQQWTQADNIIDYLEFAKSFIAKCEEKFGVLSVEIVLDAAHAIMQQGVFRYPRKEPLSFKKEMDRKIFRALEEERNFNDLWRTVPESGMLGFDDVEYEDRKRKLNLPEENILYFLEQHSPSLSNWQREILRIVRNVAQYFYPQSQTKIMNEGCATWTHYTILNTMYERGMISEGAMLEFFKTHTSVTFQPDATSQYYNGINPYAIGFAMMQDIVRICNEPTDEDKYWFKDIAGCKDSFNVLKDAWETHRDESFIRQYLSPKVIRDFRLFTIVNQPDNYEVKNIHNENGYQEIRTAFANEHDITFLVPEIEVVDVDMDGTRELSLQFISPSNGLRLARDDASKVTQHIANLWGYSTLLGMFDFDSELADDTITKKPTLRGRIIKMEQDLEDMQD